jgi:hypothetical protein
VEILYRHRPWRALCGLLAAFLAVPAGEARAAGEVTVRYRSASLDRAAIELRLARPPAPLPGGDAALPAYPVALELPAGRVLQGWTAVPLGPHRIEGPVPAGTPEEVATLQDTGRLGRVGFATFRVHPVVASPDGGAVAVDRVLLRLELAPDPAPISRAGTHPMDRLAERRLVPYPVAPAGVEEAAGSRSLEAVGAAPVRLRIGVERAGIFEVTGSEIAAAGVSLAAVDPDTLAMESGGSPVAIEVRDGGDGSLDPGDAIRFYGSPMTGRWTRRNAYWLAWGGSPGPRMGDRDAAPSGGAAVPSSFPWTTHREENLLYTSNPPPAAPDHWWWGSYVNGPGSFADSITLEGLSPLAHTVQLRAQVQGRNDAPGISPDHHTRLKVNGGIVDDQTFEGLSPFLHQVGVPSGSFSGTTPIGIDVVGDLGGADQVYIDYFEADYRRGFAATDDLLEFVGEGPGTFEFQVGGFAAATLSVYDVTSPDDPVRLTNGSVSGAGPFTVAVEDAPAGIARYVAVSDTGVLVPAEVALSQPADLLSTANGADHIILSPPAFDTAMEPLRAHREAQGLRSVRVTTTDVYDLFGDGVLDPQAIRDFLAYAYANWTPPAPAYVLLVGDATTDFLDETGNGLVNWVPPYLVDTPTLLGEAPSDPTYAMVSGGDKLPDLYVGRLPVNSAAQATGMVDKILAYETAPPFAGLNASALFVADNDDVTFSAVLDARIDAFLPPEITPHRVYLGAACLPSCPPATAENGEILDAIDAGQLMMTYLGHGNLGYLAQEGLLETADVAGLANGGLQTFAATLNCISGYFAHYIPAFRYSLMEELVRYEDRGAIAGWAPVATTSLSDYDTISFSLFENLFVIREGRLGAAAGNALMDAILLYGVEEVNAETMAFLGDPATVFALDTDADQVADGIDNCVGLANPLQDDLDGDGMGDECDPDDDGDGYPDVDEASGCVPPSDPANAGSTPVDGDGDLVCDNLDGAPGDPTACRDDDADGCDDCSGGSGPQPLDDGPDLDGDGLCDTGDLDDDADGVADAQDCAPLDPSTWGMPVPITGFVVLGSVSLSWNPQDFSAGPSVTYDVVRGTVADLGVDGGLSGAGCAVTGLPGPSYVDGSVPPAGTGFYYLPRAVNPCGDGGLGNDSLDQPRAGPACP